jgi:two-component system OmpR family response regulator
MAQHRLLVIEDDPKIVDLVCRTGEDIGFDVRGTSDFLEIQDIYDSFDPEVIVLDVVMPDMDGFEVLNFLHRRNSMARVIIFSGNPEYRPLASKMAEGLSLAIVATVPKPFRIADLRRTLEIAKDALPTLPPSSHTFLAHKTLTP